MYEVAHRGDKLKKEWDWRRPTWRKCASQTWLRSGCAPHRDPLAASKSLAGKKRWRVCRTTRLTALTLRPYTTCTRIVVAKGAELSAVGVVIGGAFSGLNNLLVNSHKKKEGKKMETSRAGAGREDVRVGYGRCSLVCRATPDIN